jgi:hypothetical protein
MDGKAQSAMEYLMTYMWAILVIVIVAAALYGFGLFNGSTTPRANPGSCSVTRPYGSGTTIGISLTGECSGDPPEFVTQFHTFNSPYDYIHASAPTVTKGTISAWVKDGLTSAGAGVPMVLVDSNSGFQYGIGWGFDSSPQNIEFLLGGVAWVAPSNAVTVSQGIWTNIVVTYVKGSTTTFNVYVNGAFKASGSTTSTPTTGAFNVFGWGSGGNSFVGQMSNIQIYNTTLSTNGVYALYEEGIGGAPIDLQNLVGWWPLNGNADDYSGNNYNGNSIGTEYSSQWTSDYTQP